MLKHRVIPCLLLRNGGLVKTVKFADAKYRNLNTYNAFFSTNILYDDVVAPTLTSSGATVYYNEARNLNDTEYTRISSFPSDFDFCESELAVFDQTAIVDDSP